MAFEKFLINGKFSENFVKKLKKKIGVILTDHNDIRILIPEWGGRAGRGGANNL